MENFKLLMLLVAVWLLSSCAATVKTTFNDTQARVQEVMTAAYARPLVVDLIVDTTRGRSGRVEDPWVFPRKEVEIDMGGSLENLRARAVYKSADKYKADIIVAPMFIIKLKENEKEYEVIVTGFPARFKNWKPVSESDYEWIRTEKFISPLTWEKISAIVKCVK